MKARAYESRMRVPTTLRGFFFKDPFFSVNWNHYDKLREHVLEVSEEVRRNYQRHQEEQRHWLQPEDKEEEPLPFPRRWLQAALEQRMKELEMFTDEDREVIRYKEDKDSLEICLDTHLYRPDEIAVTVQDGVLCIEGRHAERMGDRRTLSRQFRRTYTLPEGLGREVVVSNLSMEGVLVVSARRPGTTATCARDLTGNSAKKIMLEDLNVDFC